ncbi:hypothetical protein B0H17DRAFT_1068914 [Mycena rosella]|uniref:Uncharacterized protein n=1 Tax=Mycena rosella TaxID=1033263 RepID=A0AAD7DC69_MYCRO|nr:hypothetical protein B0H17DRAFT_1068914 [Mycena rosella]
MSGVDAEERDKARRPCKHPVPPPLFAGHGGAGAWRCGLGARDFPCSSSCVCAPDRHERGGTAEAGTGHPRPGSASVPISGDEVVAGRPGGVGWSVWARGRGDEDGRASGIDLPAALVLLLVLPAVNLACEAWTALRILHEPG